MRYMYLRPHSLTLTLTLLLAFPFASTHSRLSPALSLG